MADAGVEGPSVVVETGMSIGFTAVREANAVISERRESGEAHLRMAWTEVVIGL